MFRKKYMIYILIGLVVLTLYMIANKEWFIREHLTDTPPPEKKDAPPTLYSINKKLESTEQKVDKLADQFEKTNQQMQAQSQQAAAAKASLEAIPTGYNNVIPTK
jgi:septal ring factor EnvC (AmiA/AmiB activator)